MKSTVATFGKLFLIVAVLLWPGTRAVAQTQTNRPGNAPVNKNNSSMAPASGAPAPLVKQKQRASASNNNDDGDDDAKDRIDNDSPEQISKREAWFYKQRASAKGHIPAGARVRALRHMQRMMEAEAKLSTRPQGRFASGALSANSPVTNTWKSIGPTPTTGGIFSPVSGRVTTVAVDPSDATGNTVLIGGAQGGIWRTTNAGATWAAVGDANSSLAMGSIAFAPSNPSIVYAGTGEEASIGFDIYYGAGVLKSTDGGVTWKPTCTTQSATCPFVGPSGDISPFGFFTLGGARISYVAVNPANAKMVLVGAQTGDANNIVEGVTQGVYCTDDGGSTWANVLAGEMSSFVGFTPTGLVFAALGNPFGGFINQPNGNGIYEGTDSATGKGLTATSTCSSISFAPLTGGSLPAQSNMGRIDLGISPSFATDNTIYASIADSTQASTVNLGVWISTDGGATWTQTAAPDICQFQCWYDNVIKVEPTSSGTHVFLGGSSVESNGNPSWVMRTMDSGATWSPILPTVLGPGLPHVDNHAIAFANGPNGKIRMYLGNDGGMWRTDDAEASTVTWINLNDSTLTLSQFFPAISVHPSTPSISFAGTQDNGSQDFTGTANWVDNQACGDGTGSAIDNIIPSTVYVTCNGINIAVSVQNGEPGTFRRAVNGINLGDTISFVPPLATDSNAANVLYAGTTKVYQSVDTANTWTAISGDLSVNPGITSGALTAIAVAPGDSKVIYAGATSGEMFVATDVAQGFATFNAVAGQANLPPRAVTAIAIDGSVIGGTTAYAAFSGFSFVDVNNGVNDPTGHLFKTTDGGATWSDISCTVADCSVPAAADLPNTPVNDIVLDPDLPGTIYAATDIGVYQGVCAATCTWSTLSAGLPRVAVLSLRLHAASRTLRAATHGRGAWDLILNNFTFPGPHISSLTPASANAGPSNSPLTLTVTGNGLTGGAIQWNGSAAGVTQGGGGSDTQLTASIAGSLQTSGGIPSITVLAAGKTSNALTFTLLGGTGATLTSITPSFTPTQTPSPTTNVQITVAGTGFIASSKVQFDGLPNGVTTTFNSATSLTATLPMLLLGPFGSTNDITVLNGPPGGGISNALPFQVKSQPPANDNIANATVLGNPPVSLVEDTAGATVEATDSVPSCVAQQSGGGGINGKFNTVWFSFTPTADITVDIDTTNSSYDTVLTIFTGTPGNLTEVPGGCNDDINPGLVIQSQLLSMSLSKGTTYFIMASSFGPPDPNPVSLGGQLTLNFANSGSGGGNPPPVIASLSPASKNAGDAGFTLTVIGANFTPVDPTSPGSGSFINFNNVPHTSTFVSSTQMTAQIASSEIAQAGSASVWVFTPTPGGGHSNTVAFTIVQPGFTVSGSALTAGPGSTANSTITVTPSGGFTGTVAISCPAGLPPGVACATLPSINVTDSNPATGMLTLSILANSPTLTASVVPDDRPFIAATSRKTPPPSHPNGWLMASVGTGFFAFLALVLPGRKRCRAALGIGLLCLMSFVIGCGGKSGGSGGNGGGPIATTTQMTVSLTKVPQNGSITVTATVAPAAAAGTIQFVVDGANIGQAAPLTNGSTGAITVSVAMAPTFLPLVGTHSIFAMYTPASGYIASKSGTLNITVTGQATVNITGTSGSTTANGAVPLTIQ